MARADDRGGVSLSLRPVPRLRHVRRVATTAPKMTMPPTSTSAAMASGLSTRPDVMELVAASQVSPARSAGTGSSPAGAAVGLCVVPPC